MSELPRLADTDTIVSVRSDGGNAPAHPRSSDEQDDGSARPAAASRGQRARRNADGSPTPIRDLVALPALLTVSEAAEVLRVGRTWVYEHAAELGGVKLGPGQTAPLRIPSDGVRRMVGLPLVRPERRSVPAEGRRKRTASTAELRARPRL